MEDGRNGVHVQNATYKRVVDAAECTNVFRQGWSNRTMGQTDFETRTTVFFSLDMSMVSENVMTILEYSPIKQQVFTLKYFPFKSTSSLLLYSLYHLLYPLTSVSD